LVGNNLTFYCLTLLPLPAKLHLAGIFEKVDS
jgi:hypothetical protein